MSKTLLDLLGLLYLSVVDVKRMKLVATKMLQKCSSARYDEDSYGI